jgi:hypothetical protein
VTEQDPRIPALQYLAQIANDFCAQLPVAARVAVQERAQAAIKALEPAPAKAD